MKQTLPLLLLVAACGHPTAHTTTPTTPASTPTASSLALPAGWGAVTAQDPVDGITYLTISASGGSTIKLSYAHEGCDRWSAAEQLNHATTAKLDAGLASDGWLGGYAPSDDDDDNTPLDLCRPSGAGSVQGFLSVAATADRDSDLDAVLASIAHDADGRGDLPAQTDFATSTVTSGHLAGILPGWSVQVMTADDVVLQLPTSDSTSLTVNLEILPGDCATALAPRASADDDPREEEDPGTPGTAARAIDGWPSPVLTYDDDERATQVAHCKPLSDGRSLEAVVRQGPDDVAADALLASVGAATK